MKLEINYLHIYTKQITEIKNELLHLQDIAEVTADVKSVQDLSAALEELKAVVGNLLLT